MKTKLLIAFFCFFFSFSRSQTFQWAKQGGGPLSDKSQAIDVDDVGNSYIGGFYNVGQPAAVTITFGGINPQTNWGKEGFLAKVDKNGNYVWLKEVISGYDERVLGVHVDRVNNFVYATGCMWGWGPGSNDINFGTCYNNANYGDADQIYLGKFDLNGNCQWLVTAGGESDDHGLDMTTDQQGNIYLTGFFSDKYSNATPAQFGVYMMMAPLGDSLSFVAKISPSGVFQWVRSFGGCDSERDNKIECDSAGNVYIAGGFYGTKSFGTTTLTAADHDVFVVKYDKNGNFQWVKTAGSALDDRANSICIDPAQQIYITGEFRDYCVFGTDTLNNNGGPGGRDIFVAKLTPAGSWKWAKKAGSSAGGERGNGICTNNKGNIFVTGTFADTAKFGGNITLISAPTVTVDVFVAGIDSLGKWRWAVKGGGIQEDKGNGIACDDSCYVYTTGWFDQSASFGTNNLTSYGSKDVYVARLKSDCFTYTTDVTTGINYVEENNWRGTAFPNPASELIQVKIYGDNFNLTNAKIRFVDVLGRDVNVPQVETNNLVFDVSSLNGGIYFVIVSDETYSLRIKFIKK
jgi:hypothetical protein